MPHVFIARWVRPFPQLNTPIGQQSTHRSTNQINCYLNICTRTADWYVLSVRRSTYYYCSLLTMLTDCNTELCACVLSAVQESYPWQYVVYGPRRRALEL